MSCIDDFVHLAMETLSDRLDERGQFAYSAPKTLCRAGDTVIYGLNPGQDGECFPTHPTNCTLRDDLQSLPSRRGSQISEQCWLRGKQELEPGQALYQKRTRAILSLINQPDALVTNLIFFQTKDAQHLGEIGGIAFLADRCWPVHEWVLNRVRPSAMLVYGLQAGEYIFRRLKVESIETHRTPSSRWTARVGVGLLAGKRIRVLQIPHISRFSPEGSNAVTFRTAISKLAPEMPA